MFQKSSRFSRTPRSFGGRPRYSGRFQRSGHRPKTFDPSMLVRDAAPIVEEPVYQPKHRFADFGLDPKLQANIEARRYTTPTPIQDQSIPLLMEGKDMIGLANTGTGKTAAFLLPLIHKTAMDPQHRALIIAPTRELAAQIEQELRAFARGMRIFSALCIGGVSLGPQIYALRSNPQFVIGTPGRLKDLSEQRAIRFSAFTSIVLDEVDRMLDMGFIHDIRDIVGQLPQERHSLFFSATMPPEARTLALSFLRNPVTVSVAKRDASANVKQDIVKIAGRDKVDVLHELLNQAEFEKVLVFGRTKHGMDKLERLLEKRGVRAAAIHGNKSQSQRQRALTMFKQNRVQVLLATDVASRGLDIDNVTHVINFDLPESYEDYLHRIGRTGRANKKGIALTFL